MNSLLGWLRRTRIAPWDLGSNPRSPQIISIILFKVIPCSIVKNRPPCDSSAKMPCVSQQQSNGLEQMTTVHLVNMCHREVKKSNELEMSMGHSFNNTPQFQPNTPSIWFIIFFSFFLFYFSI